MTAKTLRGAEYNTLRELHDAAESYLKLSRVQVESLREEASHRLRNALAVARDELADAVLR